MSLLKALWEEARPQFLLWALVCVLVGASLAVYENFPLKLFDLGLATAGAVMAHASVHCMNDYSDYVTGIDLKVHRTPFSGGSGVLPLGKLRPTQVYHFGILLILAVICIGIYFMATVGLAILLVGLVGIALVFFYTSYMTRVGLGELGTVIGFPLWSIGTYFVQTGRYSLSILLVSLIPSLIGTALLLLNEFPDVEADKSGGRRNIPIAFGLRRASWIYSSLIISTYLWLLVLVVLRTLPIFALLAFVTLPMGIRVVTLAVKGHGREETLTKALKLNATVVLVLPLLMSIGTIIASIY